MSSEDELRRQYRLFFIVSHYNTMRPGETREFLSGQTRVRITRLSQTDAQVEYTPREGDSSGLAQRWIWRPAEIKEKQWISL